MKKTAITLVLILLSCGSLAQPTADLLDLTFEELLNVTFTTIGRRTQALSETAAAVYVITAEDISNSPATSLPDLLRVVPGLDVAQIDANKWAVSARGFNARVSSRTLVFIDGRSVFTPAFASVFWELLDLPLQSIERIDIIRGPGATSWGANAVNGVINITTKNSADTQGGYASLRLGTLERALFNGRYGGEFGDSSNYRFTLQSRDQKTMPSIYGGNAGDDWTNYQIGLRIDSSLNDANQLSFQLNSYDQNINQELTNIVAFGQVIPNLSSPISQTGTNISARWVYTGATGDTFTSQVYVDQRKRKEAHIVENAKTYDLDFYWNKNSSERHNLVVGAGVRLVEDDTRSSALLSFDPDREYLRFYNVSIQDDYRISERNILGLGYKFENNVYTGDEHQANISLNHTLNDANNLWIAYSRAVRLPSRFERRGTFVVDRIPAGAQPQFPFDIYTQILPDADNLFGSENLLSTEAGWRFTPNQKFKTDIALFFNRYGDLSDVVPGNFFCMPDPYCIPPIAFGVQQLHLANQKKAKTWGFEGFVAWEMTPTFDVELSFNWTRVDMKSLDGSIFNSSESNSLDFRRGNALYRLSLQANWQLDDGSRINGIIRSVSKPGFGDIDSYTVLDLQYTRHLSNALDLKVTARNLGDSSGHQEFDEPVVNANPALIEPMYSISLEWSW